MPTAGAGNGVPVRVVFFGSGSFAMPILAALIGRTDVELVGVVSPPDGRAGRNNTPTAVPVAVAARSRHLPLLQYARVRAPEVIDVIRQLEPDLGVLADFGQLIPQAILDIPAFGILNVHPSLLPRHRGAAPIAATILAGDSTAGVSIMQMDAGLDTGPVVAAKAWALSGTEDAPGLEQRAAQEGAQLLDRVIDGLASGPPPSTPQGAAGATMTRPLQREAGRLDPNQSAIALERQVRAFRPWPGTFVELDGLRVVVHEATVGEPEGGDIPGMLVMDGDGLALTTAEGRLLLRSVQPAGGRSMSGAAFRHGRPGVVGSRVLPGARSGPSNGVRR